MFEQQEKLNIVILPKYTTRPRRKDDDKSIINVEQMPPNIDVVYEQYGHKYGFSSMAIFEAFKRGITPVVIINNEEVLKKLQDFLGDNMKSYFIHREKPTHKRFLEIARQRGITNTDDIMNRLIVANKIYSMYTDNIQLFDGIILNTNRFSDTKKIVTELCSNINNKKRLSRADRTNKLILVAGDGGSGKDVLVQTIETVGGEYVPKHTTRKRKPDDGQEMICSDDEGFNLSCCDMEYENNGNIYGIETSKIWTRLWSGKPQIMAVSDIYTIKQLKEKFGSFVQTIYVHSDKKQQQDNTGEIKFDKAFYDYSNNVNAFDAVFLYYNSERELLTQLVNSVPKLERNIEKGEIR